MISREPPKIATWLLKHLGSSPTSDAILGDLQERYQQGKTALWYWQQTFVAIVVSCFPPPKENDRLVFRTSIPILQTISVKALRKYILIGLALCVLALAAVFYPDFPNSILQRPRGIAVMALVVIWSAYAAIYRAPIEDSMVLNDGVKWGLAVGCAWAAVGILLGVFRANELGEPLWFGALFCAVFLPFGAGAAGAIKAGRVRIGMRVGFWCGVVGGLTGFLSNMASGSIRLGAALLWSGQSISELGDGIWGVSLIPMFLFGTIYGVGAGTIGGWVGLKLYRTGELVPETLDKLPASLK